VDRLDPKDLSEVLALLAHDLRNPLSALLTNVNFLRTCPIPQDGLEVLSDASICCTMLGQFVTNLDVISRSLVDSAATCRPVPASKVASEGVGRLSSQARAQGIKLRLAAESEGPNIWVDPRWVGRALDNLLANSLQYAPPGSPVTVELATRDQVGVITILDDGPVVPPDLRGWCLSMKAQSDAKQRFDARYGRGLGLYCAAQAAQIGGARVTVGERAGGAMFEITGPLAP
jgi:signal transduction histidine kinase